MHATCNTNKEKNVLTPRTIQEAIPLALAGVDIPGFPTQLRGKVRDIYLHDKYRVIITTDRVSAFDRILGLIPFKGQILNQLSAWWYRQTADIVASAMVSVPDPNVMIVRELPTIPVEVIVRGYITGVTKTSLWYLYQQGERQPYGIPLTEGLHKNAPLPHPIITPTTKATGGGHDERLTRQELIERELVPEALWEKVESAALALFARGQARAAQAGLILVDTKYDFGFADGEPVLIDEVHTPDSSRYWLAENFEERLARGEEPESMDKEFLRRWLAKQGYRGDSEAPPLPDEIVIQTAQRYMNVYERLTGETFVPAAQPAADRIAQALQTWIESGEGE